MPTTSEKKPTPKQLLQQLETEEACSTKADAGMSAARTSPQPPSVSPEVKAIVSMLEVIPLKTSRTTLQAARIRIAQHSRMMKQQPQIYNRAKSAGATE